MKMAIVLVAIYSQGPSMFFQTPPTSDVQLLLFGRVDIKQDILCLEEKSFEWGEIFEWGI